MPMRAPKASARGSRSGYAPVTGARWTTKTRDEKWRFVLQGQYLDAKSALIRKQQKAPALPGLLLCVARLGALLISSWEYTGL